MAVTICETIQISAITAKFVSSGPHTCSSHHHGSLWSTDSSGVRGGDGRVDGWVGGREGGRVDSFLTPFLSSLLPSLSPPFVPGFPETHLSSHPLNDLYFFFVFSSSRMVCGKSMQRRGVCVCVYVCVCGNKRET